MKGKRGACGTLLDSAQCPMFRTRAFSSDPFGSLASSGRARLDPGVRAKES